MVRTRVYGWLWSEKVFIGVHSWWQLRLLLPSGRLTSLWFPYEINEPGKEPSDSRAGDFGDMRWAKANLLCQNRVLGNIESSHTGMNPRDIVAGRPSRISVMRISGLGDPAPTPLSMVSVVDCDNE